MTGKELGSSVQGVEGVNEGQPVAPQADDNGLKRDDPREPLIIEQRRPPWFDAVSGLILAVMCFLYAWFITPECLAETSGYGRQAGGIAIYKMVAAIASMLPIRLWVVFCGFWALAAGAGSIWRIVDPQPLLIIDSHGLRFHPSVHRGIIPWSAISGSRLTNKGGRSPFEPFGNTETRWLQIDLERRIWSLGSLWPRKRFSLSEAAVARVGGLREAARLIRRYRLAAGWRR